MYLCALIDLNIQLLMRRSRMQDKKIDITLKKEYEMAMNV